MNPNDVWLNMEGSITLSQNETMFVNALFAVLFIGIVVIAICDIIEPKNGAYRAQMAAQMAEHVSERNIAHPNCLIEMRQINE